MGVNTGPVRPMGKTPDYDNRFDQLMSEIDIARRQGLIDVISSYDRSTSDRMTIGAVMMGNYPLNPRFMLWATETLPETTTSFDLPLRETTILFSKTDDEINSLAITQCRADGPLTTTPRCCP